MATATATNETKLEDYTVAELKEMADEMGIQVSSHATKDELIKALKNGKKGAATEKSANQKAAAGPKVDPKVAAKANFDAHSEEDLKKKAQEEGIEVAPDATKAEVSAALVDAGVEPFAFTNTLPLADMIADVYGIGVKYTVTLADIQALGAFLTGTLVLPIPGGGLPPGSIMQLVRIKHSQSVAGPSITACTVQVVTANNNYGSAFDIFQPVSNTALSTVQLTTGNVENFATVTPVNLNLSATGGNLGVATAGVFSVWLRYTALA